jgi:hypothetical protein
MTELKLKLNKLKINTSFSFYKKMSTHLDNTVYNSYMNLPLPENTIQAEYIWIGGNGEIRSKTRVSNIAISKNIDMPYWNYDGSSTEQADSNSNTEVILKPCKLFKNPLIIDNTSNHYLVLCETYNTNLEPLPTNHRHNANKLFEMNLSLEPWFGLEQEYFMNATSSLVTVKCFPWIRNDQFALIGDAAHAIVPFFGQGMNCGFEDCSVLNSLMEKYGEDWSSILQEYQLLRKPDGDAIADLAINNFVEMRDKVADPVFILQKKIEAAFSAKHPDKWTPAYSLVTFSPEVRYSEALRRGHLQQGIMDEIMQTPGIDQNWNDSSIETTLLEKIKSLN